MSFTDSADNTRPEPPPPAPAPDQADPLASPQGPQPRRPMNWPANTLPALATQWNPQQSTQDPNNPTRVAADQTADASGFSSGTPGPFQLPPPGPYGPHGPRAFAMNDRQMFIPGAANLPPHMWGKPRPYPVRPPMWQIPGIYSGIGNQLAQWGPGTVAPFAAMMGQGSGAWMRGYMRGQAALTNQQYQQMRMASWQTEQNLRQVVEEYGAIYSIYGDDPKYADRVTTAIRNAALKYHDQHMLEALDIGSTNARRYADWLAAKHGDLHVTNREREAAESRRETDNEFKNPAGNTGASGVPLGGPSSADEPAGGIEPPAPSPPPPTGAARPGTEGGADDNLPPGAGWGDDAPAAPEAPPLLKAPSTSAEPDAQGKKYPALASSDPNFVPQPQDVDKPAADAQPEAGDRELGGLPQVAQAEPGAARTPEVIFDREEVPARPGLGAGPERPRQPRVLTPAQQGAAAKNYNVEQIDSKAEQWLIYGPSKDDQKKFHGVPVTEDINRRVNEMRHGINQLLDPNSKIQGDELVRRVTAISPKLGNWVEMFRKGELPVGRGGAAQFLKEPMGTILALAKKAEPGMNLNEFQQRATFQRWLTTGQGANQLIRLGTAYGHSAATIERLENMPNRLRLWLQSHDEKTGRAGSLMAAGAETLDPEAAAAYGQLNTDMRTLAGEYMAIMAMTGAGSMTEREGIRESLDWRYPNQAIGQIKEMMERIKDREGALRANASRAGMNYDQMIQNIGSAQPPKADEFGSYDPKAGAAGMRQMEMDRGSRGGSGGTARPPANYDSLPSGAEYTDSEGNVRRKR